MVNGVPGCCDTGPQASQTIGRQPVNHYAGIDVSLELSSVCIVDATGEIVKGDRSSAGVPGSSPVPLRTAACSRWRDGLIGQGLSQLDFARQDRARVAPGHYDHPPITSLPRSIGARPSFGPTASASNPVIVTLIRKCILKQNDTLREDNSAARCARIWLHRPAARYGRRDLCRPVLGCHDVKQPTIEPEHGGQLD
jgi:hypothetical protein